MMIMYLVIDGKLTEDIDAANVEGEKKGSPLNLFSKTYIDG